MVTGTPQGRLVTALIGNSKAGHMFEVLAHPYTAGETVAQSRLGALKVNGCPASATVVDRFGNGDYLLRITLEDNVAKEEAGQDASCRCGALA